MIRSNDNTRIKLYERLYVFGSLYKKDISNVLENYCYDRSVVTRVLNKDIKEGYIKEITFGNADNKDVLELTYKGRRLLEDRWDKSREYMSEYEIRDLENKTKYRYNHVEPVLEGKMRARGRIEIIENNKLLMYISETGIRAMPYEKPSFTFMLENYLCPTGLEYESNKIYQEQEPDYIDSMISKYSYENRQKVLSNVIEQGVYYTKKEISEYEKISGSIKQDTFKGTVCEGVVFKRTAGQDNVVFMFLPNQTTNNRIKSRYMLETNFVRTIRKLVEHGKFRFPPKIDNAGISTTAAVLCKGKKLISAMSNAAPGGQFKTSAAIKKSLGLGAGTYEPDPRDDAQYTILGKANNLDTNSSVYNNIIAFTDNADGILQLKYIFEHNELQWLEDSMNAYNILNGTPSSSSYGIYVNQDTVYLPVYNCSIMRKIYSDHTSFINKPYHKVKIITKEGMEDAIAKCVRLGLYRKDEGHLPKVEFISYANTIDDGTASKNDNVLYYDDYGMVAGKHIVQSYLERQGKVARESQYDLLPTKLGLSYVSTYNSIALGNISAEKAADLIDTSTKSSKPYQSSTNIFYFTTINASDRKIIDKVRKLHVLKKPSDVLDAFKEPFISYIEERYTAELYDIQNNTYTVLIPKTQRYLQLLKHLNSSPDPAKEINRMFEYYMENHKTE